jgi:hypothetical protein
MPYFDLEDRDVCRLVGAGSERLPRPAACPERLFDALVLPCWAAAAADRPTFAQLEAACRTHLVFLAEELEADTCCMCGAAAPAVAVKPCNHAVLCAGACRSLVLR